VPVSRHAAGSLLVAGSASTWGIIGIIVRQVDAPAMTIVFFRVALAALFLAGVLTLAGRRDLLKPPPWIVLGFGVLLAAHWSLYFQAIKETSVASAVLITYAAPIFMALLAPLMLRERISLLTVAALVVSMAGIALISLAGGSEDAAVRPLGVGLAVLAAISLALLFVLTKRYAAQVEPVTLVLWESLVAGGVLAPAALLGGASLTGSEIGYLVLLGVVLTGGVNIVFVGALRWVPATTAGVLAYMEPVSGALLAALLLGEELNAAVIAGGLAIVAAGVVVVLERPEPLAGSPEDPARSFVRPLPAES
jgi:drug/metabolite transporter (DMT)-like permease